MINLLEQAIDTNDGDWAAKLIQYALGIESNEVANYCFPKMWPQDREQRARMRMSDEELFKDYRLKGRNMDLQLSGKDRD
jgi:hypothetical protein